MSHANLAKQSLQYLRGKAHALAEEKFPDRHLRYAWLKENAPNVHMSQLRREQLCVDYYKLEKMGLSDHCEFWGAGRVQPLGRENNDR